jgi:low temperature requirement protein LtrA
MITAGMNRTPAPDDEIADLAGSRTMTRIRRVEEAAHPVERVTPLELFFDLVFVFTITQLTALVYHDPSWRSLAQVVLMLGVIWWMYGGYAWLTNAVPAHTTNRRLLLLGGMGGFFVLALAVPRAFHGSGLAFGLAYLVIVVVHLGLFTRTASVGVLQGIVRLAPFNVACALVVVAGGALGGTAQYVLWAVACLVWLTPFLSGLQGFAVGAAHFVERHGLVILIAIGESVVAVGIGAEHLAVDARLVLVASLGLALSAGLWWLYFGGDAERAEAALASLEPMRRAWAALRGFGYWHFLMLLGIVTIAAGERVALPAPFRETSWANAALLSGGLATFLAGDVLFRRELGIGRGLVRAAAAVLVLAAMPIGAAVAPALQVATAVAVLGGVVLLERGDRWTR